MIAIDDKSDLSLVYLKDGKPHCKKHGAMNCNEVIENRRMYRCYSAYRFNPVDLHLPIERRRFIDRACDASCVIEHSAEASNEEKKDET
ncbi:MAG: hypothetical protein ACYTBJ_06255 [Planctomycetota bacterium]